MSDHLLQSLALDMKEVRKDTQDIRERMARMEGRAEAVAARLDAVEESVGAVTDRVTDLEKADRRYAAGSSVAAAIIAWFTAKWSGQ